VDDCDLIHVDMVNDESALETFDKMQASVRSWGMLLIATGGSYKPDKSSITLSPLFGIGKVGGLTLRTTTTQTTRWLYRCQMGQR